MSNSDKNQQPGLANVVTESPAQSSPTVSKQPHSTESVPSHRQGIKPFAHNLILPRSPLIGRVHEFASIQQLLLQEHIGLLTLTGPGGIGKTRLAMQVAANLLDHFVDGVYFVALALIQIVHRLLF